MGVLVYEAPRNGPTLWEIGIPDRTAAEFYIPDPNPRLMNELYVVQKSEKLALPKIIHLIAFPVALSMSQAHYDKMYFLYRFRQYGLWERYTDLYPDKDLVYTVGSSTFPTDWFFAHVNRFLTLCISEPCHIHKTLQQI